MPKNDKKLKLCWMLEKFIFWNNFRQNMSFLRKSIWSSRVPFCWLSWQFSTNSPFLPSDSKKTPPPAPRSEKHSSNSTFFQFQGKFFSRRSLSGQIKTQFWQSVFKVQKTSAEGLEKVLQTLIQTKKDRLPKKTSRFVESSFSQSCWNFSKIVRNFAPKF